MTSYLFVDKKTNITFLLFTLLSFYFLLVFFLIPQDINAQTCTGSGFTCYWNCDYNEVTHQYYNCKGSQNRGCGVYPDCNIMPNTSGCDYWTGSCRISNPATVV